MKPTPSKKTPNREIPVEALTTIQNGVMPQDKLVRVDQVEEDTENILVTQEGPISDFEKITSMPNPPPTITLARQSKRLSEKRRDRTTRLDRLLPSRARGKRIMSILTRVPTYSLLIFLIY